MKSSLKASHTVLPLHQFVASFNFVVCFLANCPPSLSPSVSSTKLVQGDLLADEQIAALFFLLSLRKTVNFHSQ